MRGVYFAVCLHSHALLEYANLHNVYKTYISTICDTNGSVCKRNRKKNYVISGIFFMNIGLVAIKTTFITSVPNMQRFFLFNFNTTFIRRMA